MNDEINRAIRKAAGRKRTTPQTDKVVVERQQNAVMNEILRAAAGVPDRLAPPPTSGNDAEEKP